MKIVYLMSHPQHLPYLVASLYTLRKSGWSGAIQVHCWKESLGMAGEIRKDDKLVAEVQGREPRYRGKNAQFIDKIALLRDTDEPTLYLDADTTIHGSLNAFDQVLEGTTFICSQFNDWWTGSRVINGRIKRIIQSGNLRDDCRAEIADLVERVTDIRCRSVNGGVLAVNPGSPVLPLWHDWTMQANNIFIADEAVLHLMPLKFPHQMIVMPGGAFNCSPKFQPEYLEDPQVLIRHYHGDANVRTNKGKKNRGPELWKPIFAECLELNIAGISDWWQKCNNKYLNEFMRSEFQLTP